MGGLPRNPRRSRRPCPARDRDSGPSATAKRAARLRIPRLQTGAWVCATVKFRQIYRDKKVSDAAYNAAVAKYGEKGVTDIIGLASYYGITAMALITANAPTAPGGEPKLMAVAQVFPK